MYSFKILLKEMLKPSQYWLIETDSLEQFKSDLEDVDIPIDSNMLVFTGNKSDYFEIFDIYRPYPQADIRFFIKQFIKRFQQFSLIEYQVGEFGVQKLVLIFFLWTNGS